MIDLYQQIFFTTIAFAFGLLHLFLFLYNRECKNNLYFTIFLFFYALNIFFDFQESMSGETFNTLIYLRIHRAVLPYNSIFALLFLYSIFEFTRSWH